MGKLVREVSRKQENNEFDRLKELFLKVLAQTRHSTDKTYSLHEPEVSGQRKKLGSKMKTGLIWGEKYCDVGYPINPIFSEGTHRLF